MIINFANPDMVGHTGVEAAAVKAVETVDECVGRAVEALKEVNGQMFICADHGNAEQLVDYETDVYKRQTMWLLRFWSIILCFVLFTKWKKKEWK